MLKIFENFEMLKIFENFEMLKIFENFENYDAHQMRVISSGKLQMRRARHFP